MEKFVCFLMCLIAMVSFVNTADPPVPLKCYKCSSDKLDGCIKSGSLKDETCGAPLASYKSACSYKVWQDTAKKTYKVSSGCETFPEKGDLIKDLPSDCKNPPAGMELKECRLCLTEHCNSSTVLGSSIVSMMCLPLMYFVSKIVFS